MGGKHLFFHEYSCESLFPKVLLLGTGSKSPPDRNRCHKPEDMEALSVLVCLWNEEPHGKSQLPYKRLQQSGRWSKLYWTTWRCCNA